MSSSKKSNDLRNDSPLKKKEGDLGRLSIQVINSGRKIVVRNSLEVLIPHNMQDELIEKFHETHLATKSMMKLAKDRFYWTEMRKQIFNKYNECEECQVDSVSKVKKPYEIVPADLTLLAPGEELNVDFLVYNGKSILVIVDLHSGYVFGEITKDQSAQSAWVTFYSYINTFRIPHR